MRFTQPLQAPINGKTRLYHYNDIKFANDSDVHPILIHQYVFFISRTQQLKISCQTIVNNNDIMTLDFIVCLCHNILMYPYNNVFLAIGDFLGV